MNSANHSIQSTADAEADFDVGIKMTKEEIENAFETDFTNPSSIKSGEYLVDNVLSRARKLEHEHKSELVEVLRSWIQQRTEPRTMLAVTIAGELRLTELRTELDTLTAAVKSGECFLPFYLRQIERALTSMER